MFNISIWKVVGGWQYEADQRHAYVLVEGLGLTGGSGVRRAGLDAPKDDDEQETLESRGSKGDIPCIGGRLGI